MHLPVWCCTIHVSARGGEKGIVAWRCGRIVLCFILYRIVCCVLLVYVPPVFFLECCRNMGGEDTAVVESMHNSRASQSPQHMNMLKKLLGKKASQDDEKVRDTTGWNERRSIICLHHVFGSHLHHLFPSLPIISHPLPPTIHSTI